MPDDCVLRAYRIARRGGTRRGGAALLPVLADPFVEIMHGTECRECLGITTCELNGGWHGHSSSCGTIWRSGDGNVRSPQPAGAVRAPVGFKGDLSQALRTDRRAGSLGAGSG